MSGPPIEATGSRQSCSTPPSSALLSSENLSEGSSWLLDADVSVSILETGFLLMKLAMNLLKTIPLSANVCGERRPGTVLEGGLDPLSCPLLSPWKYVVGSLQKLFLGDVISEELCGGRKKRSRRSDCARLTFGAMLREVQGRMRTPEREKSRSPCLSR